MHKIVVGVKGRRACFNMSSVSKQNRFSSPVIPPSAARGVLSSIFRKPEFDWVITRIAVMNMGYSDSMCANELKFPDIKSEKDLHSVCPVENRLQVSMRILRDVDYIIEATPIILNKGTPESPNTPMKYLAEFDKRIKGKKSFFLTPCLGMREFVARIYSVDEFPKRGANLPDMVFPSTLIGISHPDERKDGTDNHYPFFKDLNMTNGIIEVPYFCASTFKPGDVK